MDTIDYLELFIFAAISNRMNVTRFVDLLSSSVGTLALRFDASEESAEKPFFASKDEFHAVSSVSLDPSRPDLVLSLKCVGEVSLAGGGESLPETFKADKLHDIKLFRRGEPTIKKVEVMGLSELAVAELAGAGVTFGKGPIYQLNMEAIEFSEFDFDMVDFVALYRLEIEKFSLSAVRKVLDYYSSKRESKVGPLDGVDQKLKKHLLRNGVTEVGYRAEGRRQTEEDELVVAISDLTDLPTVADVASSMNGGTLPTNGELMVETVIAMEASEDKRAEAERRKKGLAKREKEVERALRRIKYSMVLNGKFYKAPTEVEVLGRKCIIKFNNINQNKEKK